MNFTEGDRLRIGDTVRCVVGDVFIHEGLEGVVDGVSHGSTIRPTRAWISWANDTRSKIDATHLEVIAPKGEAA